MDSLYTVFQLVPKLILLLAISNNTSFQMLRKICLTCIIHNNGDGSGFPKLDFRIQKMGLRQVEHACFFSFLAKSFDIFDHFDDFSVPLMNSILKNHQIVVEKLSVQPAF